MLGLLFGEQGKSRSCTVQQLKGRIWIRVLQVMVLWVTGRGITPSCNLLPLAEKHGIYLEKSFIRKLHLLRSKIYKYPLVLIVYLQLWLRSEGTINSQCFLHITRRKLPVLIHHHSIILTRETEQAPQGQNVYFSYSVFLVLSTRSDICLWGKDERGGKKIKRRRGEIDEKRKKFFRIAHIKNVNLKRFNI